ncbi:MAG TPA: GAF domain-containing protein [Blastocatellia bacterium]|nr:GAF domain-containing protein [Blastocatellia bacterium]
MKGAEEILARVRELAERELSRDEILRGAVSVLKQECPHYNWVGIYLLEGDILVLHNYLGKATEHTRIPVGTGVCGSAVRDRENKIVGDVTGIENYLACSVETRAEIVVLIRRGEQILGQIDIDSDTPNAFGASDEELLERVAQALAPLL